MDLLLALIAFLFMLSFLHSIRAVVQKEESLTGLFVVTALLFGGMFWMASLILTAN